MAEFADLLAARKKPAGEFASLLSSRKGLAAAIDQPRVESPDVSGVQAAEELSPTQAVLARAGAEFSRIIPNLQRLAADITGDPESSKQATAELEEIDKRVQALGEGQPISAFGAPLAQAPVAIAGLGASLLGGLPLAAQFVAGGVIGAAEATAFAPTEADPTTTAGIGAALGTVAPAIPGVLGAAGRLVKDIAKPITELVEPPVKRAFEQGRVFTSDLFPPDTFIGKAVQQFGERVPVIGTGGQRAAQQKERVSAVENIADEFNVDTGSQFGKDILDSLDKTFKRSQTTAKRLRKEAVGSLSRAGEVPLSKSISEVDKQISKIEAQGATGNQALLAKLQDIKSELSGNFERVAQQRTNIFSEITDIGNRTSPLGSASDAPLKAVAGSITEELTSFAQTASRGATNKELAQAANKWRQSNKIFASDFEKAREASFKKILRGGASPEAVESVIKGGKRSELERLFKNLDSEGRQGARQIIIQDALDKAGFPENINPTKFINALDSRNSKRAANTFFKGMDRQVLDGYKKFLNLSRRAQQAGVVQASQAQVDALNFFTRPLINLVVRPTVGGISRAGESAPFRNILIRLGKAKSGSATEKRLGEELRQLSLAAAGPIGANQEDIQQLAQ